MNKYKNTYRIQSNRLKNWDYSSSGAYFITICTKDKIHYFGNIIDGKMRLSEIGKIAYHFWKEIPKHFPFVCLDKFVIIPNHMHGIIIIDEINHIDANCRDAINCVSTVEQSETSHKTINGGFAGNKNPLLNNNLSRVIRWYKGRVTFECRKTNPKFAWQPNYYDHIIRNNRSYDMIKKYIYENQKNWQKDKFYN